MSRERNLNFFATPSASGTHQLNCCLVCRRGYQLFSGEVELDFQRDLQRCPTEHHGREKSCRLSPLCPRPLQVQRQQPRQDLLVAQVVRPAVGVEHGRVQLPGAPGRARSAAGCRGWSGCASSARPRVAPAGFSHASRFATSSARRLGDGLRRADRPPAPGPAARGRGRSRRWWWGCSGSRSRLAQLRAHAPRPQLVDAGVQDAEEVVVVAGEDEQLLVWQDFGVDPDEDPVLGHLGRRNVARQCLQAPLASQVVASRTATISRDSARAGSATHWATRAA